MNNSQVHITLEEEPQTDPFPKLQAEEARLVNIIEALRGISQTKEWSSLKKEVFDSLPLSLEKELKTEARKETPDPNKLNRLSGELKWAERFSDLEKLESVFKTQLQQVRARLMAKNN